MFGGGLIVGSCMLISLSINGEISYTLLIPTSVFPVERTLFLISSLSSSLCMVLWMVRRSWFILSARESIDGNIFAEALCINDIKWIRRTNSELLIPKWDWFFSSSLGTVVHPEPRIVLPHMDSKASGKSVFSFSLVVLIAVTFLNHLSWHNYSYIHYIIVYVRVVIIRVALTPP